MKRHVCVIGLLIILLLSVTIVSAQERFQAGLNFMVGSPQGEFKDNVSNVGLGLSADFLFNIAQSPLHLGANMGFMVYGHDTREEPWSTTIPDVKVDVETTNSLFDMQLMARLQNPQGKVRPYFDGYFGFNYLFTETSVKDQDDYEEIASSTNFDDFTMCYGVGAGTFIKVHEGVNEADKPYGVYIDLGVRYIMGNEAEYLKEGSIEIDDNHKLNYDVQKSTTDLLTFHLGVAFTF